MRYKHPLNISTGRHVRTAAVVQSDNVRGDAEAVTQITPRCAHYRPDDAKYVRARKPYVWKMWTFWQNRAAIVQFFVW